MSPEDVHAFFAALGAGRFDDIAGFLAEDVVLVFPGRRFGATVEGRRRVVVFLRQGQRLFPDGLRFDVTWAGVAGDRAVAEWTNAGTTRDGQPYENRGCTLFTFADGVVTEIHDHLDTEKIAETWPR